MEDIWMTNELHGASVFSSCNSNFQLIGLSFEALHLCVCQKPTAWFPHAGRGKSFKPQTL